MKRIMIAAVAALSLVVAGHGTVRAAGQPQCETGPAAGAAPGQQYGTKTGEMAQANIEAKKQADADKYRSAEPNTATQACPDTPPVSSPSKK